MLRRPRQPQEMLSISALDLFASALGVFLMLAILLYPYYLNQPAMEEALAGAKASLAEAAARLTLEQAAIEANTQEREAAADAAQAAAAAETQAAAEAAAASQARKQMEARLARAQAQLAQAQAAADKQAQELERALAEAREAPPAPPQEQPEPKPDATIPLDSLDLVFVMDTTNSMRDEFEDIRGNLRGLARVLQRLAPSLRIGFVAYRDQGEAYVTRAFPLAEMTPHNLTRLLNFLGGMGIDGGGDIPEAVDAGLEKAVGMAWRGGVEGRIVVIGDAPVHARHWDKTMALARNFRQNAGARRLISTIYTDRARIGSRFFRELATMGGGDFVGHRGRMFESVLLSLME